MKLLKAISPYIVILGIIILVVVLVTSFITPQEMSYDDFFKELRADNVKVVEIEDNTATPELKKDSTTDENLKAGKYIVKIKSIDNFDKNKNIYRDLIYAVENTDIGINHNGDFLVSMDDHFYIKETDFDNYPYYVKDYIPRQCRHYLPLVFEPGFRCENYQRLLVSTANFLKDRGLS